MNTFYLHEVSPEASHLHPRQGQQVRHGEFVGGSTRSNRTGNEPTRTIGPCAKALYKLHRISSTYGSSKHRAGTRSCLSFQFPQSNCTLRQHCPGQRPHVWIRRSRTSQEFLACLLLSEPAPHHSAKKHIVAVHLVSSCASVIISSPGPHSIQMFECNRAANGRCRKQWRGSPAMSCSGHSRPS